MEIMQQLKPQLICKCGAVIKKGDMLKHWREQHLAEYNKLKEKGIFNGRH
jgi:hypothetical protein